MTRLLLVLLLVASMGWPAVAAAPVAMVTDVQGSVPGVSLGRLLEDGARLDLGAGTRVRLVYMGGAARGRREVIAGPATVQIGAAGAKVTPASAVVVEKVAASPVLAPTGALQRLGGSVERGPLPLALLPTVGGAPRFAWLLVTPGESILSVRDGERVLWECRTVHRVVDYAGPPLEPDHRYFVKLLHEGRSTELPFQVISEGTRRQLEEARKEALALARPDDPTPHLLMLERYLEHDMFAEAASEARAILDLREDKDLRDAMRRWQKASR